MEVKTHRPTWKTLLAFAIIYFVWGSTFLAIRVGAVSVIDIRDIAAVAVLVLAATGHEGKSYSLTGGEALTNGQVSSKISRVAGRKISYLDLPPDEFKKAILSAGMPEWSADALLDLQRLYREGKASPVSDDVERLTGRKPITFDQFT